MATKPTELPAWNTGLANNVDPPAGKKVIGWVTNEVPPSSWFNWFMELVYEWCRYLKDALFRGDDGTGGGAQVGASGQGGVGTTGNEGGGDGLAGTGGIGHLLGFPGRGVVAIGANSTAAAIRGADGVIGTGGNSSLYQGGPGIHGIGGIGLTANGPGIFGEAAGATAAVLGRNSSTGPGVQGQNEGDGNAGDFAAFGLGVAVRADTTGGTGTAVNATSAAVAVNADSTAGGSAAVVARASTGTGVDVTVTGAGGPGVLILRGSARGALALFPQGGDPSAPAEGDIWYDSGTHTLRVRINGVTKTIAWV